MSVGFFTAFGMAEVSTSTAGFILQPPTLHNFITPASRWHNDQRQHRRVFTRESSLRKTPDYLDR